MSMISAGSVASSRKSRFPEKGGASLHLRHQAAPYFIGLSAYVFITIWALWRVPNQYWGMYGNMDGMWAAWNTKAIIKWGYPFDFSPYNMLSGMGSMFAPNLPWLNPGALSLGLPLDGGVNYVISYSIYLLELLASLTILMRVIGLSPLRSIVVAQLYAFVLFPPTSEWFLALRWYSLAPFNAHLMAMANFVLCLFLRVGSYRSWGNITCILGSLVLTFSAVSSAPVTYLTYVPAYVLMASALLASQSPRLPTLLWKLVLLAAIAALVWGIGLPEYLAATRELSARTENLRPQANISSFAALVDAVRLAWEQFSVCGRPQELLCRKYPIFWFHFMAMTGAIITLFMKSSKFRPLAVSILLYYALLHAWEMAAHVELFGKLHVISVPFLMWSAYPFFALFLTLLIFSPYDYFCYKSPSSVPGHESATPPEAVTFARASPTLPRRRLFVLATTLLTLLIPLYAYHMWKRDIHPFQPQKQAKSRNSILGTSPAREPLVGDITHYLIEHASIALGGAFRGYTVSYFGDPLGHIRKNLGYPHTHMGWEVHVRVREYLDTHYNNSFQEMDLWQFDIPTVEEYGQWVTKQAHFFVAKLFSSPEDAQNGAMLQIYKLDIDLLRAIGTRFVITDLVLSNPRLTLRAQQQSPTAGPIQLYEITGPNLATFNLTDITRVDTFEAAMKFLQQDRRELDRRGVVFDEIDGPFVQASQSTMLPERDGFRVKARSSGRSLLLLPVQYSRCLSVKSAPPASEHSPVRLIRANGIQTLLVFDHDVDIHVRFEFGLFGTAQCRRSDTQDLLSIGIPG